MPLAPDGLVALFVCCNPVMEKSNDRDCMGTSERTPFLQAIRNGAHVSNSRHDIARAEADAIR
jgi:hypothetical protein